MDHFKFPLVRAGHQIMGKDGETSGEAVKGRLQNPGGCKENRNIVSSTLALVSCCNLHLGTEKKQSDLGPSLGVGFT